MKKKRPRISRGYIKIIPLQKTKDNSVSSKIDTKQDNVGAVHSPKVGEIPPTQ